jgi:hypothetical protein
MKRRDFLWTIGAASLAKTTLEGQATRGPAASLRAGGTVLYDSRAVALARVDTDASGALWVPKNDLLKINGFEIKPQGACRADICIPIPRAMMRGDLFNLTAFATRVGQKFIADPAARVWSFGEIPVVQGAYVESRIAPDVGVPDRKGRTVRLSQFRGKKVLLVTWASW